MCAEGLNQFLSKLSTVGDVMLDKGNSGSSRIILLKDYAIYTGKWARNKELHVEKKKKNNQQTQNLKV